LLKEKYLISTIDNYRYQNTDSQLEKAEGEEKSEVVYGIKEIIKRKE